MTYKTIQLVYDSGVATITLNRPEKRNAISFELIDDLLRALKEVETSDAIVLILTGAGKAFCSGLDLDNLKALLGRSSEENLKDSETMVRLFRSLYEFPKVTIAAVNGAAIAGGTEILQATDIRVAGESARFGIADARWGLFPLGGSAVRLVRQVPYTVAADLLLTGRPVTAAEALRIGLIGHVVPDGQALPRALEIADQIAANGPVAVRAILRAIRQTEGMAENDAFAVEAKIGMEVFRSEDAKEGPRAFAEKRRPQFQDR